MVEIKKIFVFIVLGVVSVVTLFGIPTDGDDESGFKEKSLTLVFDSNRDEREFGFSTVPVSTKDSPVNPVDGGVMELSQLASVDGLSYSSGVHAYWKVLSSESFELELSGSGLTDKNGNILHLTGSWSPEGYDSLDSSSFAKEDGYSAKPVLNHDPDANGMSNHGSVEIMFETEEASHLPPGVYTGTITLGVKAK